MRDDSSAGELSSPPSGSLSDPDSPSRRASGRPSGGMGEIVVGDEQRQAAGQAQDQQPTVSQYTTMPDSNGQSKRYGLVDGQWVPLTAAGVPRKKPGRKPGVPPKAKPGDAEQPKARKPRKPRDPNAPPAPRRRKIAPAADIELDVAPLTAATGARALAPANVPPPYGSPNNQPRLSSGLQHPSPSPHQDQQQQHQQQQHQHHQQPLPEQRYSPKIPKREGGYPGSMQNILNADPPSHHSPSQSHAQPQSQPSTAMPKRTSGQSYDPIRGNYDPVRETIVPHNPYTSASGSPRAPTQIPHRSPSIASLIEPSAAHNPSPSQSHHGYQAQPRFQAPESSSMPPSPSQPPRPTSVPTSAARPPAQEAKKDLPPPPAPAQRPVIKESNFTTIANGPIRKTADKPKVSSTGVSTPLTDNLEDTPQDGESRSILDFGRARPGEEVQAPTIVLSIPITAGETNKYVNFTRLAEDRYGWDALHPRLAANRDRKARIAAAAASLEKIESGRESGDEMSVDLSDAEASNPENGGTSGPDAQAKPKKKRNFKEDQYDVDDEFVDDSELLWEAQAAASRDGFFVYSGPLVPEVEKPAAGYVTFLILFV